MAIPTSITNRIRNVLDERVPRRLRNARWFMYPFFFVWCKGKHVREWMDFKELAPRMSVSELRELYRDVDSFASGRPTDTHPDALAFVLSFFVPALAPPSRNAVPQSRGLVRTAAKALLPLCLHQS